MTRWELVGRYYGELIARRPRLKRRAAALIDVSEALWKWGKRAFWAGVVLVVFFATIGDILMYISPSSTYGYGFKYNIVDSKVSIEMRPHDCEWGSAPLGDKHCHYTANVQSVRTSTATDGTTPLVSYDQGKTWSVNTTHEEPSVFVSWTKVGE